MSAQDPNIYGAPVAPTEMGDARPAGPRLEDYEFNAEENGMIGRAALWSRVLGALQLLEAAHALYGKNILGAIFYIVVGFYLLRGGGALDKVVKTDGNDIPHLMTALGEIASSFRVRVIAVGIAIVFTIGGVLLAVAIGATLLK